MARDPWEARILGLWTAAWLAGLLLAGFVWLGDLSIQWPVLVVPLLWALVALRPRRRRSRGPRGWEVRPAPGRTDTVERPMLRDRRDVRGEWD